MQRLEKQAVPALAWEKGPEAPPKRGRPSPVPGWVGVVVLGVELLGVEQPPPELRVEQPPPERPEQPPPERPEQYLRVQLLQSHRR